MVETKTSKETDRLVEYEGESEETRAGVDGAVKNGRLDAVGHGGGVCRRGKVAIGKKNRLEKKLGSAVLVRAENGAGEPALGGHADNV